MGGRLKVREGAPGSKLSFLIVENDPNVREVLEDTITGLGQTAEVMTSQRVHITRVYQRVIGGNHDILILNLDWLLNQQGAAGVLDALSKEKPDVKVFAITGNPESQVRGLPEEFFTQGRPLVAGILHKPDDTIPPRFQEFIQRMLRVREGP